jgi:hypothetical protein
MKIQINIDEIEFEGMPAQGEKRGSRTIKFNFHDQLRIKKAFERELTRLFSDTKNNKNKDFPIESIFTNNFFFMSKNYGNINLIKEIDGGKFSLSATDKNPSQIGKRLAESIYSNLNLTERM